METDNLTIYCDGGSRGNPGPAASAFVVVYQNQVIFKGSDFLGRQTNNVAEYQAVILALTWLKENEDKFKDKHFNFVLDSELVVRQLKGIYRVKNENLYNYFCQVKEKEKIFSGKIDYTSVSRQKNKLADELVNKTLDRN